MMTPKPGRGLVRCLLMTVALCAAAAGHAGSWQQNVAIGGFNNVHIYTPDSASPIGNGKALLIVLHGCVQPIDNYLTANLEDAAEEFGMVVAVPDAMNKAGYSCWSYWDGTKSRTAGDYNNLINLANALSGDNARGIDADQVYIAGLSSGASFANTTACLAPDVFAGMGVSAGPSIGTSSNGALGPCETADVASRCSTYAGSYASFFDTQIASIAQGDADTTVNQCYNTQNSDGMAELYGVSKLAGTNTIAEGTRTAGETLWQDGRVSMLWFNGVDHAWSGGEGASGSYISDASINYARYLGQFFVDNNKRVDRNKGPVLSDVQTSTSGDRILVSGTATDAEGSVTSVEADFDGDSDSSVSGGVDGNGFFSLTSAALADDLYVVTVVATDNDGAQGEVYTTTVRVGPEPPATAPALSNVAAQANGQCVTVSGTVVDENQDLDSVVVTFSNGDVPAAVVGTDFSAEQCDLPGGSGSAQVTATDLAGLSSTASASFTVDAGVTATLDNHISAGRLDYTNYANCYLEYSTDPFRLDEYSVGAGQCQWRDDDASCVGPQVTCSSSGGSGGGSSSGGSSSSSGGSSGGSGSCTEQSTYNYYHKTAGRAYSTGNALAPDYFANGSDDAMPGSTWGLNTLHSTDGFTWEIGACP
ncbi:extracellular catalytic domain type 1 short-chain-length polyhydroxyalkanoate depolymerase [Microbulbifer hainanensis]|uniref:extracellular catalytic domain type 1 short-chain-length polyhydroxyalkanoate depolymerase n=1 Tax=Microbulbifer hainanensis TaxID=2735675 RepID=UPI001D004AA0|nr:PHB depolymerase family esterase [Microbulbifer hainanensis]